SFVLEREFRPVIDDARIEVELRSRGEQRARRGDAFRRRERAAERIFDPSIAARAIPVPAPEIDDEHIVHDDGHGRAHFLGRERALAYVAHLGDSRGDVDLPVVSFATYTARRFPACLRAGASRMTLIEPVGATAGTLPPLVASRRLRLTLFTAAYFSQGVPIGLLVIALPAWLSAHGTSLGEIAAYQGIVGLPWGFKLIAGPFMDRFAFPAMGRRRPWIIGAQAVLTLAFAALAFVSDPLAQLPLVIAIGFVVNAFAALQDVAVDGMAIDVLAETETRRAQALM